MRSFRHPELDSGSILEFRFCVEHGMTRGLKKVFRVSIRKMTPFEFCSTKNMEV